MNTNTGGADIKGQKELLLEYLRQHKSVSKTSALSKIGISHLAEIVRRLRVDGHDIETVFIKKKNRYGKNVKYARYILRG